MAEENEGSNLFSFSTDNNVTCFLKAKNPKAKKDWVDDLRAIFNSQMQMKKGKDGWCGNSHSMLVIHRLPFHAGDVHVEPQDAGGLYNS